MNLLLLLHRKHRLFITISASLLLLVGSAGLLQSYSHSKADSEKELRDQLVGTWKILSASFDGKPSELHQKSITLKHITPVHVQWIGYQPDDRKIFRSAGGSWNIRDGKYVETMRYGLNENFKQSTFGKDFPFDCKFEEDRWIQSGTLPNGSKLIEIWQRVKPDEDVSAWPK